MIDKPIYDIFISYSRRDTDLVEPIVKNLSDSGLRVWLDKWSLTPGQQWQKALEDAVSNASTIAVFIGPSGLGSSQLAEIDKIIGSGKKIIPILLPGADANSIPPFLQNRTWVDFRDKSTQKNGLNRLLVTLDRSITIEDVVDQERQIADDLFTTGDLAGASERYEGALKIAKLKNDKLKIIQICIQLGNIKTNLGDLASANHLYQEGLGISRELKDQQSISAILNQMAYIFTLQKRYEEAMRLYREALEIKETLGDKQGKSATLHNIAQIYVMRGDLDQAMMLYQQSLELDETLGDIKGKSATLHAMASIYEMRGELDEAIRLYHQALKIQDALGDQQYKSATLHNMAQIYVTRGELDQATNLYKQSLEIDESLGYVSGKAATETMLAKIHIEKKQYNSALTSLLDAFKILIGIGNNRDAEKAANIILNLQKSIGNEAFDTLWKEVANEPLPKWLSQSQDKPSLDDPLTEREWELLDLLSKGISTELISQHLGISPRAVHARLWQIVQKLNNRGLINYESEAALSSWYQENKAAFGK